MFNFMTLRKHFCFLLIWSYRIHFVFPNYLQKSLPNYTHLWLFGNSTPPPPPQLDTIKQKVAQTVIKVFETRRSKCVICAFKSVRSGSNTRTESINDLFKKKKKTLERSRVIKVWSIVRVVFNSSIIGASLKCHPLFTSSIKCLTSMMW